MDPVLSYNFDEIEHSVRLEIHTTSARFNAALEELRSQIAPLQHVWTREAAAAYRVENRELASAVPASGRSAIYGPAPRIKRQSA